MSENRPPTGKIDAPPERPLRQLTAPFRGFILAQESSGWLLLSVTILAIALSNSPLGEWYRSLVHVELGVRLGDFVFKRSLQHWVNDGLMAMLFFLLGLELKRELLVGQLSEISRMRSVACAAVGGMVVPALVYLLLADTPSVRQGWAIPVATDTAFALMILLLLGNRVPSAVRAFLVGLAIVDDLGAILIIAVAYTADIQIELVVPAVATVAALVIVNMTGVRSGLPYFLLGSLLWLEFLYLGLHGTLAGVVAAAAAPVRPGIARDVFVDRLRQKLERFQRHKVDTGERSIFEQPEQQQIADDIQRTAEEATPPLNRWEMRLEKPISLIVMPLFAFLNAGFVFSGGAPDSATVGRLSYAIAFGLLVGKPFGILLGVVLGKAAGLAEMPAGVSWQHILGVGMLGGIGFTMSIFIATLSFDGAPAAMETAKQSIILTSFVMGILGYAWLRWGCPLESGQSRSGSSGSSSE